MVRVDALHGRDVVAQHAGDLEQADARARGQRRPRVPQHVRRGAQELLVAGGFTGDLAQRRERSLDAGAVPQHQIALGHRTRPAQHRHQGRADRHSRAALRRLAAARRVQHDQASLQVHLRPPQLLDRPLARRSLHGDPREQRALVQRVVGQLHVRGRQQLLSLDLVEPEVLRRRRLRQRDVRDLCALDHLRPSGVRQRRTERRQLMPQRAI